MKIIYFKFIEILKEEILNINLVVGCYDGVNVVGFEMKMLHDCYFD